MALAFVQSAGGSGTSNVSLTINSTTQGNGLIIFLGWATSTLTGGAISGETVTAMGTKSSDTTLAMDLHGWVVNQLATGGSKSFTATVTGNYSIIIMEFSGQNTTDFYLAASVAFAGDQSGGTQSVNVSTNAEGQAAIGFGDLHNAIPTAGANYTFPSTNMSSFVSENWRAEYDTDLSSSIGTVAVNMGNTGTDFWAIKGYVIQAGAAPGTTPITVTPPADSLAGGELV